MKLTAEGGRVEGNAPPAHLFRLDQVASLFDGLRLLQSMASRDIHHCDTLRRAHLDMVSRRIGASSPRATTVCTLNTCLVVVSLGCLCMALYVDLMDDFASWGRERNCSTLCYLSCCSRLLGQSCRLCAASASASVACSDLPRLELLER